MKSGNRFPLTVGRNTTRIRYSKCRLCFFSVVFFADLIASISTGHSLQSCRTFTSAFHPRYVFCFSFHSSDHIISIGLLVHDSFFCCRQSDVKPIQYIFHSSYCSFQLWNFHLGFFFFTVSISKPKFSTCKFIVCVFL